MTTQTLNAPQIIEAEAGRNIVIVVDGKPVVFLRADKVRERSYAIGDRAYQYYNSYEFCGMGVTLRDKTGWNDQYVSGCATTMALEVNELTTDAVIEAATQRYGKK